MTQPTVPLSVRAHAAASLMYQSDHRGTQPKPEDFALTSTSRVTKGKPVKRLVGLNLPKST